MTWWQHLARWLRRFDGAQRRRDIRELRLMGYDQQDPYLSAAEREVDALLDKANWPQRGRGDR
jgi:hypothetical protein